MVRGEVRASKCRPARGNAQLIRELQLCCPTLGPEQGELGADFCSLGKASNHV